MIKFVDSDTKELNEKIDLDLERLFEKGKQEAIESCKKKADDKIKHLKYLKQLSRYNAIVHFEKLRNSFNELEEVQE